MKLPNSPVAEYLQSAKREEIAVRAHRYLYDSGPDSDWDFEDLLREQAWRPREIPRIVRRQYRHIFGMFRRPKEGRQSWSDFIHGVLTDASLESLRKFYGYLKESRPKQYIRIDPKYLQAAERSKFNELRLEQLLERTNWAKLVRIKHPDTCEQYPEFDRIETVTVDVWVPEKDPLDPLFERYTELPSDMRLALTEAKRPLKTNWDINPDDYRKEEEEFEEDEIIDFTHI